MSMLLTYVDYYVHKATLIGYYLKLILYAGNFIISEPLEYS